MKVRTVVLVLAAALALAGCSKEIEGTPMADQAATVTTRPWTRPSSAR